MIPGIPGTVFTNGVFDILHVGHLHVLNAACRLGRQLIVGLNSDVSVKALKGNGRPINNQLDRRAMLLALSCVYDVLIFDETNCSKLIREIKPDVYVKSGAYTIDTLNKEELSALRECDTEIVIIPPLPGYSTSRIVKLLEGNKTTEALVEECAKAWLDERDAMYRVAQGFEDKPEHSAPVEYHDHIRSQAMIFGTLTNDLKLRASKLGK